MSKKKNSKPQKTVVVDTPATSVEPGRWASAKRVSYLPLAFLVRVIVGIVFYTLAVYMATFVVPNIVILVQSTTGVLESQGIIAIFGLLIAPSLFFIGLIFVVFFIALRGIWRYVSKKLAAMKISWVPVNDSPSFGRAIFKKSASSQK